MLVIKHQVPKSKVLSTILNQMMFITLKRLSCRRCLIQYSLSFSIASFSTINNFPPIFGDSLISLRRFPDEVLRNCHKILEGNFKLSRKMLWRMEARTANDVLFKNNSFYQVSLRIIVYRNDACFN